MWHKEDKEPEAHDEQATDTNPTPSPLVPYLPHNVQ